MTMDPEDVRNVARQVVAFLTTPRERTPEEIAESARRDAELRAETEAVDAAAGARAALVDGEAARRAAWEQLPPEVVFVAITLVDGALQIMQFVTRQQRVGADPGWTRKASVENINNEIQRALVPHARAGHFAMPKTWRIIDPSEIPADRTFRNAWLDTGTAIAHDMTRVRELALDHVRRDRVAALVARDRDWMRATGQGDATAAATAEAERRRLRDLPLSLAPKLAACESPLAVQLLLAERE